MANNVFANGREISCKKADGKSICAFPDVCFTPPENPATPPGVPIPYPNTGMAKDTTSGSKKVQISKKEVLLKNKSYFKKSMGDEAGAAAKKGVLTSTNRGKVYFTMWSMDVKVEGQNVVRHLDLTTHNHMSFPGNSPPWAYADTQAVTAISDCEDEVKEAKNACSGKETKKAQCNSKKCRDAKRCLLITYKQGKRKGKKSKTGCCPGEQPHHLVEAHCFYEVGSRGKPGKRVVKAPRGKRAYNDGDSPCVCAKGPRHEKEHGQYHAFQQKLEAAHHSKNGSWTYKDARNTGVKAHKAVNGQCSEECTTAQLDAYHKDRCGMDDSTPLRTDPQAGTRSAGNLNTKQKNALQSAISAITGGTTSGSP
ncbi:PAAR-like domain-containing protein [Fuerstiella marisgermanici]|uniref:Tox-GHH2 domain-containing protein n=1 Tax=Fuerstiella marisgermanici TaxID=1891926 RepID=A0A1P8WJX3_9PLAN|nr:PAAR-like domain-containing protein [Fuerstiella marisgermanici]APZ94360.1 hypothetical protein Fuma_03992 [Fuerstiella marisgermanici]